MVKEKNFKSAPRTLFAARYASHGGFFGTPLYAAAQNDTAYANRLYFRMTRK